MVWKIEWEKGAEKDLLRLDRTAQNRILTYVEDRLATDGDPFRFGKALTGPKLGLWRYRVDSYRIICRIEQNRLVVAVIAVGHRSKIYE